MRDCIKALYNVYDLDKSVQIISGSMEKMREEFPEVYKKMKCEIENYLYTIPLDEAKKIVSRMNNEYSMSGERWSYEQICEVASQYQLSESINRCDLYIVMNMWNMDYCKTMKDLGLENNIEAYLMFSRDWLCDSDFGKGKVYKYFVKIHEGEEE